MIADIWIIPKLNVSGVDYDFVGTGTGVIFQVDRRHLDHPKLNVSGVDYDFVGTGTGVIFQVDRRQLDHPKTKCFRC